jgi:hypothetical protein
MSSSQASHQIVFFLEVRNLTPVDKYPNITQQGCFLSQDLTFQTCERHKGKTCTQLNTTFSTCILKDIQVDDSTHRLSMPSRHFFFTSAQTSWSSHMQLGIGEKTGFQHVCVRFFFHCCLVNCNIKPRFWSHIFFKVAFLLLYFQVTDSKYSKEYINQVCDLKHLLFKKTRFHCTF